MWSQIQRKLYDLIDPNLKLQVHCAVYPGGGRTCLNGIPRFWVMLGGEVIFDCLHDYMFMWQDKNFDIGNLPLEDDIAWCCGIVIRYFQAPVDCLMTLQFYFPDLTIKDYVPPDHNLPEHNLHTFPIASRHAQICRNSIGLEQIISLRRRT